MKQALTLLTGSIILTGSIMLASAAQADIFISEIIEGSSYNKAIEIGNNGDDSVTLTDYSVSAYYTNGAYWNTGIDLSDYTLAPGEVLVLANSNANEEILAEADIIVSSGYVLSFNGDDAIGLFNANDDLIDIAGDLLGSSYNQNLSLQRIYNQTPTTTFNPDDWHEASTDDWSDLGSIAQLGEASAPEIPDYAAELTIMEVQGSSDASPYITSGYESDDNYKVTGIVTGIQEDSTGAVVPKGFFIQDKEGDGNEATSDGIYVYYSDTDDLNLTVGDEVSVYGPIKEYYTLTQLAPLYVEITGNSARIEPTPLRTIDSDENFEDTLERFEGMYVELDESADMKITRTFGFDYDSYRDNMVVAHRDWNVHPNQLFAPVSDGAISQSETNALNRLFIESMTEADSGIPWYSTFQDDTDSDGSADEYLRIGALVDGMTGFIGYDYSEYRFYVEKDLDLTSENFIYASGYDRTDAPELLEGDLSIATFNVLNYFNSAIDGALNPWGSNRGADNAEDLAMQTAKIVAALVVMDADIVGLMELENNGFEENSAIVALVRALNEELEEDDQYSIVQPAGYDYIGTDAITNAVIYRASKVTLDDATVIAMPEQHAPAVTYDGDEYESGDNFQRDAVVPTFTHIDSGEQLTIAVNHLKSKGSVCYEDVASGTEDDSDLQGSCEALRVSGAYYLAEQLAETNGHTLIIGDLNSYGNEDAIMLLTGRDNAADDYEIHAAAYTYIGGEEGEALHGDEGAILSESYGYINLTNLFDAGAYSYSYNDEVGTLDYILGSKSLENLVVDSMYWNINAGESSLFQYDYSYGDVSIYEDAYRSSDHDPAIVVLKFDTNEAPTANLAVYSFFRWYIFVDRSTDSDGHIKKSTWQLGPWEIKRKLFTVSKSTINRADIHEVTLTVTDNDGAESSITRRFRK